MIDFQLAAHKITIIHISGVKLSIAQGANWKAVLARKMLKKDTVFKEFSQKRKNSQVNCVSVKLTDPRTRI